MEHANTVDACWAPRLIYSFGSLKKFSNTAGKNTPTGFKSAEGKPERLAHCKEPNNDLGNQTQGGFTSGSDEVYEIVIS